MMRTDTICIHRAALSNTNYGGVVAERSDGGSPDDASVCRLKSIRLNSVDTSAPQTFTINITAVNDAPSFTKGPDQTVLEGAGPQTVVGWATAISPGPADEAGQTVNFIVTTSNDALFSVLPVVAANGTLTYTLAADANGPITVTVSLHDNGGTANSGVDTSAPQTFTINGTDINDPPSFAKGANQSVLEDAGPQTVVGWATNISPGPSEATQTVSFTISTP